MWRGSRSTDGVECRFGGAHAVTTARLRVASARWSDGANSGYLNRDQEAQHWLGWTPRPDMNVPHRRPRIDPLLPTSTLLGFAGVHAGTGQLLAWIEMRRRSPGTYEVGGMVDPDFRGQGYGHEALLAVCLLAHGHFGVPRLIAGCESTNSASQKWLIGCGFARTDGPPTYTLPNGRATESLWWQRLDSAATRQCRRLTLR
jgi:RimJ/RimL family protein N-acetyltransferase